MMCEPSQMKLSEAIALELGATPISATPSWTENKHATFKEAIKIGAQATASLCDDFAEVLPFPGGAVTALLGQVAKLVSSAMANHDNLLVLQNVAAELMDVIIEKHVSKVVQTANQGGSKAATAGSRMYYQLMARFRDLLDEILTYAKDYNNKIFIVKLLMTGHCRERYQELVDNLAKLLASAHFSVSLDTHSMVTDVQNMSVDTYSMVTNVQSMTAEMRGMVEDIRSRAKYTDRSSEVKHLVDELGGYDAVANSDAKLDEVVKHLDSGQQIEIAALKKQARAGLMALEAAQQEGVHSLVKHTDMRTFWRKCFKGLPKVDWEVWWEAFPSQLMVVVQDKAVVEQVTARLSTEADLRRFQKFVGKDDNATISVKEVNDTFPSYMNIPKAVDRALGLQEDGVSEATAISGSPEAGVLYRESLASACLESQGKEEPKASQDALAMYSKQGQVAQGQQSSMPCQPEDVGCANGQTHHLPCDQQQQPRQ
ncbi:hypothetical protein DUNSADRAFT_16354 [Dunaliella salina]|uniref:Uncharacterized protein n=1 Tax=Dunaliella salina TaxID=3046 RepID=A0ABQ7H139_DUNSA|nr:hypothetical protein DUNSADRAFT_16354 [Dunaliella salina]KAF5840557.1 hypothetical protein DUNSADRAFT_16354 [Dunaliella salina]|eukprot:KAF5840556.1 hypothetical protein DUNSADRAFT_16354 [Dunaliella salina]